MGKSKNKLSQIIIPIFWYLIGGILLTLISKFGRDHHFSFGEMKRTPLGLRPNSLFGTFIYILISIWIIGHLILLKKIIKNEYLLLIIFTLSLLIYLLLLKQYLY
ncbi:hypothetical protein ACX8XP_14760 [Calditrichota bacterium LG25]